MKAAEWLLREIESNLAVGADRLIGRMILASNCERYSGRAFEGFSLAFRRHSPEEISDAVDYVSGCIIGTIRLKSEKLSDEFHVYDMQDYLYELQDLEACRIEADGEAEYEEHEVPLLHFSGQLEWYFFRDQAFNRSSLGCVATALGAQVTRADTFAIPG